MNINFYNEDNLSNLVTCGYASSGNEYKKCWVLQGRAPDVWKLLSESMAYHQSQQVWGQLKRIHNVDISRNISYCVGDLAAAIMSLVNTNSEVKILISLFGEGRSKYSSLSSADQLFTAVQDVLKIQGAEVRTIRLIGGTKGVEEFARARLTYMLMAVTLQFPSSCKDLQEPVTKKLCTQIKETTMNPEQFISEVQVVAEEKNLLEAF